MKLNRPSSGIAGVKTAQKTFLRAHTSSITISRTLGCAVT